MLTSHLRLCKEKATAEDTCCDYSEDAVLLSSRGVYRSHEAVRQQPLGIYTAGRTHVLGKKT